MKHESETDETMPTDPVTLEQEYSKMVRGLAKKGEDIVREICPATAAALAQAVSQAVVAGQVLDRAKKAAIYRKGVPLARADVFNPLANMTPKQAEMLHAAVGLAGEAAELLETVRDHIVLGVPLDAANVDEELGDAAFFFETMCQAAGTTRERCLKGNRAKLAVRYPGLSYSNAAAQQRLDKQAEGSQAGTA